MNLAEVMDEIATVMSGITGLNVFAYPVGSLTAPAGYVSYPQEIMYDETAGRGSDRFVDLPIVLVNGRADSEGARDAVAVWTAGDGPGSVKALMEAHTWQSCDLVTVTTCEFDGERIAGTEYLAAMFKATVDGDGAT